jgi:PAS domain S-box-containing protein
MVSNASYEEQEKKIATFESQFQRYKNIDLVSIFNGLESAFPLAITDLDGGILYVNDPLVDLWGFANKDEIIGEPITILWEGDGIFNTKKALSEKGWSRGIDIGKKKDGSLVTVAYSATVCKKPNGDPLYLLGQFFDITDHMRLESQLQHSQKMEAIGTLAGGVAHEFNNFLGVIYGNAELALDDIPIESPAKDCLDEIIATSLRAKGVVRQIMTYARKIPGSQKPINISAVVKESLNLLRTTIPTSIEFRSNILSDTNVILADETEINQILIKLCSNSTHAMKDKTGVIEVSLEVIILTNQTKSQYKDLSAGEYVQLTVRDNGIGIAPEHMHRIMDPYFTTKEIDQGLGMGLAVVSGLVKKHDGSIKVMSTVGKGTRVEILFPVFKETDKTDENNHQALPGAGEWILFVDDDASLVNIGTQMLERHGYRVVGKTNSTEALDLFKTNPNQFDLVITDMGMPEMTGDRLAQELIKNRPNVPIIICTGFSDRMDEDVANDMGVREFVLKPIIFSELIKTIRDILDEVKTATIV